MKQSTFKHWTAQSLEDFRYEIAADFIDQIESRLQENKWQRKDLAQALGKSESWVSQLFNNPGNMSLNTMIGCAAKLNMKLSVLAYDDGDHDLQRGPVHAEVFNRCWEMLEKPHDFWDVERRQKNWKFELKRASGISMVEPSYKWPKSEVPEESAESSTALAV